MVLCGLGCLAIVPSVVRRSARRARYPGRACLSASRRVSLRRRGTISLAFALILLLTSLVGSGFPSCCPFRVRFSVCPPLGVLLALLVHQLDCDFALCTLFAPVARAVRLSPFGIGSSQAVSFLVLLAWMGFFSVWCPFLPFSFLAVFPFPCLVFRSLLILAVAVAAFLSPRAVVLSGRVFPFRFLAARSRRCKLMLVTCLVGISISVFSLIR